MRTTFRAGPLGSLMDVYEDALGAFVARLRAVSPDDYVKIVRPDAENGDCASIQTMMRHVVLAGYAYANYTGIPSASLRRDKLKHVATLD